jgi:16S rRNA (cytosine1402-N4)-methyltransferase
MTQNTGEFEIDAFDPTVHVPVMPAEIVSALNAQPGSVIVDGTLGGGGHTRLLAPLVSPHGLVIGVDRDPLAVDRTTETLQGLPVKTVAANYADIPEVLAEMGIPLVDGILLDLGLSSDQLADRERGFSYQSDGELDLRFDTSTGKPAWLLVEKLSEQHLADLIYQFGEERFSRRIARRIVHERQQKPIRTARQLANLLRQCVPRSKNHSIDPATRTFQALRIAVNDELKWLEVALRRFPACLKPQGKLVIVSFHSLEDRLVKNAFRDDPRLEVVTKKPLRPSDEEIDENYRSRSSRLRVAVRNDRSADDIFVHGPSTGRR